MAKTSRQTGSGDEGERVCARRTFHCALLRASLPFWLRWGVGSIQSAKRGRPRSEKRQGRQTRSVEGQRRTKSIQHSIPLVEAPHLREGVGRGARGPACAVAASKRSASASGAAPLRGDKPVCPCCRVPLAFFTWRSPMFKVTHVIDSLEQENVKVKCGSTRPA